MDNVPYSKINKILSSSSLSKENNIKYSSILSEKKSIDENKDIIDNIIKENYDTIYYKRTLKQIKMGAIIGGSILVIALGGVIISKHNSSISNEPETITEITTTEEVIKTTEEETTENIITEAKTEIANEEEKITTEEPTTTETNIEEFTTTETTTEEIVTENNTEMTTETENITTEWYEFDDYLNPDVFEKGEEIFSTFSPYIDTMEEVITDPEKRQEALENAKQSTIMLIDFVFYGEEINGVTFDELQDETKEKIYEQLQKLDTLIVKYDPDYKEKWGERYTAVKDFASVKLDDAKNAIINKIGQEKYDEIIEKKNNAFDSAKETGGKILQFLDDSYQNWKNK